MQSTKSTAALCKYLLCAQHDMSELACSTGQRNANDDYLAQRTNELAAEARHTKGVFQQSLQFGGGARASDARRGGQRKSVRGGLNGGSSSSTAAATGLADDEPHFSFYSQRCCFSKCEECGVKPRVTNGCETEWNVRAANGNELGIKVRVRSAIKRANQFSDEFVSENLTLSELKELWESTLIKYLPHHFVHIVNGQSIRNANLAQPIDLIIAEMDLSAVHDHHPQKNSNQNIPHRTGSLIIILHLLVHALERVPPLNAADDSGGPVVACVTPREREKQRGAEDPPASFERLNLTFQFSFNNAGPVKDSNHMITACLDTALSWAFNNYPSCKANATSLLNVTDGCKGQFKNRFNGVNISDLREKYDLKSVSHAYHATATGKGMVDEEGAVGKNLHNTLEKSEAVRAVDTRQFVEMLWEHDYDFQPTPASRGSPARRPNSVDQRLAFLVMDESENPTQDDRANPGIVIIDMTKAKNAIELPGIASRYVMESVKPSLAPLSDKDKVIKVRLLYCSCKYCLLGTGDHCAYTADMGAWKNMACYEVPRLPPKAAHTRLPEVHGFLAAGGPLPPLEASAVPVIVGGSAGRLIIVTGLPPAFDKLTTRQVQGHKFSFKAGELVLEGHPLRRVNDLPAEVPAGHEVYERDGAYKKAFLLSLSQVVLPQSTDILAAAGKTRANCLGITLLPPPYVGASQMFLVPTAILHTLRDVEQEQVALGE